MVLVRLLSVEDFGRYREFLLYTSVLLSFAACGVNSSLLRLVPNQPELKWRYVTQAALMTLASSVFVAGVAWLSNSALDGKVLGEFALPAVLYVLLFVNLDFWEFLWLAEKRSFAVLGYTTGRLIARILTVVSVAALTRRVEAVVWALVCLESVRLAVSFLAWRRKTEPTTARTDGSWRQHLEFCLPFGGSLIMSGLNRSLGGLFVAKMLGPIALAHYAIGTYVQPVITVLRNSLSDVLLPEMSGSGDQTRGDRLNLFRRTTVVTAIFLFASGVVLARFAEVLVLTLFSEEYRPAVPLFQLYLLVFARECLDFGVPLRAINRTTPILQSNLLAILVNAALVILLLPRLGLIGAVLAFVISRAIEGAYLGRRLMRAYEISIGELAAWRDLAKVAVACGLATVVLYGDFWTERLGLIGVVLGGLAYALVLLGLLAVFRIPEVAAFLQHVRSSTPGISLRRAGHRSGER